MIPRAEPLFFGPPDRPRFGWLHRPAPGVRSTRGLVICNPFGYEAICAHRGLRHFAEAAAFAGAPALRFDYDGAGDSAGVDRDPGRLAGWVRSVRDAVQALRRMTGATDIFLLGMRLGALLAALAGAESDDIAGFIGIAAVASGRGYLRELRALQMTLGLTTPPASWSAPEGEREAAGFSLSAETQEALGAVDLVKQKTRPARRVLLLDRDDLPANEKWTAELRAAGVDVELTRLGGFADSVLDPHKAVIPEPMIVAVMAWMAKDGTGTAESAATTTAPAPTTDPATATMEPGPRCRLDVGGVAITEEAVFLDDTRTLFGILSRADSPDVPAPTGPRRGVLFLNAGSIHHVGPNRLYVRLARQWAARGDVVVRADISGIGDSLPRPGEAENVVYTARAPEDVRAALAFLRRQPGVGRCYIVGLCSGAYNGFKAAVSGQAVDGVIPINPLTFFWKEGMSLDYPTHEVVQDAQRYSTRVFQLAAWKKVLRGQVDLSGVAQVLVRYAGQRLAPLAREAARLAGHPMPEDLGVELDAVARRNIPLHFVFASGDPGEEMLRMQGGRSLRRLQRDGKLRVDLIDGPNHTFTAVWCQDALAERLTGIVGALPV